MSGLNRNDIFCMAREAGVFDEDNSVNGEYDYNEQIEKFAQLVAAAEREACAKLVDELYHSPHTGKFIVDAIRARGQR